MIPGSNRVITVTVNGSTFGYRRPSRADDAEVKRRLAIKLSMAGLMNASNILDQMDGGGLEWEARFEIGLLPPMRDGREQESRGETAPAHWIKVTRTDEKGNPLERMVSFDEVPPEEFAEVASTIKKILDEEAAAKKKPLTSTEAASSPPSALPG